MRRKGLTPARRSELEENALRVLYSLGEPKSQSEEDQFFELYKLMVASSEALVARRQGVNTFFLTINGLLITAVGLFLKGGGHQRLQAGGILVVSLAGVFLCFAWRSLLISFGQLNAGKFRIIGAMEKRLQAAIYAAEWEALGRGEDNRVYRSFTAREASVPFGLSTVYCVTVVLSALVWAGVWHPG